MTDNSSVAGNDGSYYSDSINDSDSDATRGDDRIAHWLDKLGSPASKEKTMAPRKDVVASIEGPTLHDDTSSRKQTLVISSRPEIPEIRLSLVSLSLANATLLG